MGNLIKGIHHVALKASSVEEFEKTVAFYHDILGMEILRTWGEGTESGIMIDTGCGIMEIFANAETPLSQGALRHLALETDDVEACAKAVSEAGYEITIEPADAVIPSDPAFPIRMAFCIGPVGEEIEFFKVR